MKKNKLIIFVFILLYFNVAFSQNDWAPIGAKWYYSVPNGSGNLLDSVLIYESIKDTVINNQICKKISDINNNIIFMYFDNQKVYYWKYNQFQLIYDFTLIQNDTALLTHRALIPDTLSPSGINDTILNVRLIVDSVTNENVNGELLKRFYLHYIPDTAYPDLLWFNIFYTEKIGSETEFIECIKPATIPEDAITLRCYDDSLIHYMTQWWSSQGLSCDYITNIKVSNVGDKNINVYPNPVKNVLNIHTKYEGSLIIRNIIGYTIKDIPLIEGNNVIDVYNLPLGVLLLEIQNKKGANIFKIIKL